MATETDAVSRLAPANDSSSSCQSPDGNLEMMDEPVSAGPEPALQLGLPAF